MSHLKMRRMTSHPSSSEILTKSYMQGREWEREFQEAPCNHTVFNGKPSHIGVFIKRRIRMDLQEETWSCLELLPAYS